QIKYTKQNHISNFYLMYIYFNSIKNVPQMLFVSKESFN
ncbi:MAG: hypothetical protein ACI920_002001, partial [Saprospiraceae bacterium]